MIDETNNSDDKNKDDNDIAEAVADGDIAVDANEDNVGDMSVEINVEELVAKIESGNDDAVAGKAEVRKQLEELNEQRRKELDSTYNFNLEDDDL